MTLKMLGDVGRRWATFGDVWPGCGCVRSFASSGSPCADRRADVWLAQGPSAADPGARLHALFDREWEWELQQRPFDGVGLERQAVERSHEGRHEPDRARHAAGATGRRRWTRSPRSRARNSRRPTRIATTFFRYRCRMPVEGAPVALPVDPHRTPTVASRTLEQVIDTLSFTSVKDYRGTGWPGLSGFPRLRRDQNIELMRGHAHERCCCRRSS